MAIAGTPRDGSALNPVAVGIGCVVALGLVGFGLTRAGNQTSWTALHAGG